VKSIRCGRGLGDSIYLQSVVRHLLAHRPGEKLRVKSDWPDVFRPLAELVEVVPFDRRADMTAHYSVRKCVVGTTQFEDCCIAAGIQGEADLRLDWVVGNRALVDKVLTHCRPVAVVQLPRTPMGRTDGFGAELLPDCRIIQRHIDELRDSGHLIVQVGAGQALFQFQGIDVDLANRTTVGEMIDVAWVAARFLGYVSFLVPLAESFAKPAHFVWSQRGLSSGRPYVRQITPEKVLHRKSTSTWTIDHPTQEPIRMRLIDRAAVRKTFEGKRVAIVGSGPGVMANEHGFVDSHDVVVRVNNYKLFPERTGARTDVFYSFFGSSIKKTAAELMGDGVVLCMCKCPNAQFIDSPWHRDNGKMAGVDFRGIYNQRKGWWFCDTYIPSVEAFKAHFDLLAKHVPTTGFAAILDVLEHRPASLYLTGFDFFESAVHNVNEAWRRKNPSDPIGHVPQLERRWLADNLPLHPITMDSWLDRTMGSVA
jgi:hypothetical protein